MQKINLSTGQEGYVKSLFIRRPIDLRVYCEKKNETWKISKLLAGD